MTGKNSFCSVFETATGKEPYPFQQRFAETGDLHQLITVPTGLGKTAMAVLGWLWRRHFADVPIRRGTPRRLVYCLPMRVLVEQTRDAVCEWLKHLNLDTEIRVTVLMGGEDAADWDIYPEKDAIIIGTQDMLLSRALNRGYGMSRARWPMAFGLLNTDCLWVFDEIQLMGSGLATTAQLEAFRHILPNSNSPHSKNGHGCKSVWMSATMEPAWLKTIDFDPSPLKPLKLEPDDLEGEEIKKRFADARKPLSRTAAEIGDSEELASEIVKHHSGSKGLTLAVVNTVKRARELFAAIKKQMAGGGKRKKSRVEAATDEQPEFLLLHSRFRRNDRKAKIAQLFDSTGESNTICVSTQVVEAGVDISATTLFTELAPWASLVQRFGRCNRNGTDNESARIFWIDLPHGKKAKDLALPYEAVDLSEARSHLETCPDVASARLPHVPLSFEPNFVIRRKDLIDLFDTTPDLAGNDIDIDRYVRDVEDSDVHVVWRDWERGAAPPNDKKWRVFASEEICPAPIGEFRPFIAKKCGQVWHWDFLSGKWSPAEGGKIYPGQTYLLRADAGGYDPDRGWDPTSTASVNPPQIVDSAGISAEQIAKPSGAFSDSMDDDPEEGRWQTIAEHTNGVCAELKKILEEISPDEKVYRTLEQAARWHDWGKSHETFCNAVPDGAPKQDVFWAKARGKWKKYRRPHFRHELAAALAVLHLDDSYILSDLRDAVAYLVAAHHGKVRLSIRSMPGEKRPTNGVRFARGIWDDDTLPVTDLGCGVLTPEVKLSLEPMELGYARNGDPSWTERALRMRATFGPFGLAYLEALLRAADMRASASATQDKR